MENRIYSDPNAYILRRVETPKQKVDLMHIEKVMYPVNYNDWTTHYDTNNFNCSCKDKKCEHKNNCFDISKLLPLLMGGKSDLNSMLPSLLSGLGVSKDIMPLLNNFSNLNKPKKVEAHVVEKKENGKISNYKRVEE